MDSVPLHPCVRLSFDLQGESIRFLVGSPHPYKEIGLPVFVFKNWKNRFKMRSTWQFPPSFLKMFDLKKIPGSRDLYFFILPALRKQLEARFFFESKIASVSTIADLRFFSALWREKKIERGTWTARSFQKLSSWRA